MVEIFLRHSGPILSSEGFHRVINRIPPIRRISENEPYINNKPHISTVNIKV